MGRKPNPIIGEYFTRGPKLTDSSNRYPHTCKLCGENFPKGRGEVLHKHITEKCPAISPADRINAALGFAGLATSSPAGATAKNRRPLGISNATNNHINNTNSASLLNGGPTINHGHAQGQEQSQAPGDMPIDAPETWSALRTLAEASRQVGANELVVPSASQVEAQERQDPNTDPALFHSHPDMAAAGAHQQPQQQLQQQQQQHDQAQAHNEHSFSLHDQFTMENHPQPMDSEHHAAHGQPIKRDGEDMALDDVPEEDKLHQLQAATAHQPSVADHGSPMDTSELTVAAAATGLAVAAAATARLNDSIIDSSLQEMQQHHENMMNSAPEDHHQQQQQQDQAQQHQPDQSISESNPSPPVSAPLSAPMAVMEMSQQEPQAPHQPWGEMSYVATNVANSAPAPVRPSTPVRGGTRMSIGNGVRSEHKRKAYTPSRRQEVKQARKKGACIRCRILRKTCGLNDPCDQCRKIQGPRHWTYPCVRTQLTQVLTIYSAGLVVVLAQNRVNSVRNAIQLFQNGTTLKASLWNDSVPMSLAALVTPLQQQEEPQEPQQPQPQQQQPSAEGQDENAAEVAKDEKKEGPPDDQQQQQPPAPSTGDPVGKWQVAMIDQDKEDLPARMDQYLQDMLPLLIEREQSHFVRTVIDFAYRAEPKTGDLVKRAIDLWGLVEILDRERSWCLFEEVGSEVVPKGSDNAGQESDPDFYNLMTWQLSAAAERKANAVSQKLVSELQRCLENGKITPHFDVYLAILILLNCVEKTTWTIKVWEMDQFRQRWPLERPPSTFTTQGHDLAELLKMLLTLRKAHPRIIRGPDGRLAVSEAKEPGVVEFFNALDLQHDHVIDRLQNCAFSPESSRSLDFHFSGLLLLPQRDGENNIPYGATLSQPTTPHSTGASFPGAPSDQAYSPVA